MVNTKAARRENLAVASAVRFDSLARSRRKAVSTRSDKSNKHSTEVAVCQHNFA
jgi:hypothetical protein